MRAPTPIVQQHEAAASGGSRTFAGATTGVTNPMVPPPMAARTPYTVRNGADAARQVAGPKQRNASLVRLSRPASGSMICAALAFMLLLPALAQAEELKIATWNLNWLTSREAGDPLLPPDIKARQEADFEKLRQYALELNADVVAVQEVDSRETIARVFPADRYSIRLARDRLMQRVGLVIRRGLHYDTHPDVTTIAGDPSLRLRSGVDVTLNLASGPLRLLAIHLKQGCQNRSLRKTRDRSCITLLEQVAPLRDWIAERQEEATAFLVLGDFNRQMDGRDPFIAALRKAAPLLRVTEGRSSPCWGREAFIDHILAGGSAREWVQKDSLRVLTYRETGREWRSRLSDHCPVSVRLATPD
jgi:endonuclease/exonuclease/phosphatase family metal-dependent hydrolase